MSSSTNEFGETIEPGLVHRRKILGDDWVDRSMRARSEFTVEFQQMITSHAWNDVWGRTGLDYKVRRLIAMSMMLGTHAYDEFGLHVAAGLNDKSSAGLSADEIKELLLMASIYCGVPVANHAFGIASRIVEQPNSAGMSGDTKF